MYLGHGKNKETYKKLQLSQHYGCKICDCVLISEPKTCVVGSQKNHLREMVLLSTNNTWFGREKWEISQKYDLFP